MKQNSIDDIDVNIEDSNGTSVVDRSITKNAEDQNTPSIDSARQVIAEEKKQRADACGRELGQLLELHRCELHTQQLFIDGNPSTPPQVIIIAKD